MTRTIPICLGICFTACSASADTYPRQKGIDAKHYVFNVTLRDDTDQIEGETLAELEFTEAGLTECALDLATPASGKGMIITELTSSGVPIPFAHEGDRVRLTLPAPPHPGERRKLNVRYRGVPASGLRIGPNRYGERTFFSDNWPDKARQWLPVIDHPYDKATSEFVITAPAHYQVVANGLLQEEHDLGGGWRTTHWKQSVPIAAWLNAMGVARFSARHVGVVRGVPIQTWLFPQDRDNGITSLESPARPVFEFFSDRIGPYPYEKLGGVEAAGVNGGMESASAIFYGETSVDGRPARQLVAHEIAHQWFGDSVTETDWDDVWLSEGFATYFAMLFAEHAEGREAFRDLLKRSRNIVFDTERTHPDLPVIHRNLSETRLVLNPLVYQKGAWTLHMLRGQIGNHAFWGGIRDYYRTYRDANANTDDFRRTMEKSSGADLGWFFAQWLTRPGQPTLNGTWHFDGAARKIVVEIVQEQTGEPYRLPLEIGILAENNTDPRIEKFELRKRAEHLEIAAEREPSTLLLDPNMWLLMRSHFAKR